MENSENISNLPTSMVKKEPHEITASSCNSDELCDTSQQSDNSFYPLSSTEKQDFIGKEAFAKNIEKSYSNTISYSSSKDNQYGVFNTGILGKICDEQHTTHNFSQDDSNFNNDILFPSSSSQLLSKISEKVTEFIISHLRETIGFKKSIDLDGQISVLLDGGDIPIFLSIKKSLSLARVPSPSDVTLPGPDDNTDGMDSNMVQKQLYGNTSFAKEISTTAKLPSATPIYNYYDLIDNNPLYNNVMATNNNHDKTLGACSNNISKRPDYHPIFSRSILSSPMFSGDGANDEVKKNKLTEEHGTSLSSFHLKRRGLDNNKQHFLEKGRRSQQRLKCCLCARVFSRKPHVRRHIENCHLKKLSFYRSYLLKLDPQFDKKKFACSQCDKKFKCEKSLQIHMRIHTGERPFSCNVCGKTFIQLASLKSHEKLHLGIKPYTCEHCGRSYSNSSAMKLHERLHTGERPFQCDICQKGYRCLTDLKRHRRSHTHEKPFPCPKCPRRFPTSSSMNVHKKIHTGIKPWRCTECSAAFGAKSSLQRHQLIHTGEKPFICNECGQSFNQTGILARHRRVHQNRSATVVEEGNDSNDIQSSEIGGLHHQHRKLRGGRRRQSSSSVTALSAFVSSKSTTEAAAAAALLSNASTAVSSNSSGAVSSHAGLSAATASSFFGLPPIHSQLLQDARDNKLQHSFVDSFLNNLCQQ